MRTGPAAKRCASSFINPVRRKIEDLGGNERETRESPGVLILTWAERTRVCMRVCNRGEKKNERRSTADRAKERVCNCDTAANRNAIIDVTGYSVGRFAKHERKKCAPRVATDPSESIRDRFGLDFRLGSRSREGCFAGEFDEIEEFAKEMIRVMYLRVGRLMRQVLRMDRAPRATLLRIKRST